MNVISFSLFGNNPIYCQGCLQNAQLKKKFFKKWSMWVYHDDSVPEKILTELSCLDVTLINMNATDSHFTRKMSWRFLPIAEYDVDFFISRDCDSRLSLRDEIAVNEWMISNKSFHIIRDHPIGHKWVINAGLWGAKGLAVPEFTDLFDNYEQKNIQNKEYTFDQMFLRDEIYSKIKKNDLFLHDEFYNYEGIGTKIKRERHLDDYAFLGERIDEYGNFTKRDRQRCKDYFIRLQS